MQLVHTSVSVAGRPPVEITLDLDAGDEVLPWLLEHDWIDEPVQRAFLDHVFEGARVLDLGSHLGLFSLSAAALGAQVLAVDAVSAHVERLRDAAQRNGFGSLRAVHGVIAQTAGSVRVVEESMHSHVAHGFELPGTEAVEVQAVDLGELVDGMGWDALDVIKMDIEGNEPAALRELHRFLAGDHKPVIVFECNGAMLPLYGSTTRELRATVEGLGYRLFHVDNLQPGVLAPTDAEAIQPEHASDYLALPADREPPAHWEVVAHTREQIVTRLLDTAAETSQYDRRYAAGVLAGAPGWLRDHPLTAGALAALRADVDPIVPAALNADSTPPAATAPEEAGAPDDVRVLCEDVALLPRTDVPDRVPGREGAAAVSGVSFHVRAGQYVAIAGDVAGGNLILDALADLAPLHGGELMTQGHVVALTRISDGFEPQLTVAENIVVFGSFIGCDAARVAAVAGDVASDALVGAHLDEPLASAPRATAARIALVLALVHADAELLLVDDLGALGSKRFAGWVDDRVQHFLRSGGSIVQSVPRPEALIAPPRRALRIENGRVVACGHAESVLAL